MEILIASFSVIAIFSSIAGLVVSLYTLVELKAMKKSTHKVEYMPIPMPDPKIEREFKETFNEDYNSAFVV